MEVKLPKWFLELEARIEEGSRHASIERLVPLVRKAAEMAEFVAEPQIEGRVQTVDVFAKTVTVGDFVEIYDAKVEKAREFLALLEEKGDE